MMVSKLPSFDELVVLAKDDPEQLEQIRSHLVDKQINEAPEHMHRKLRGLQFRIDSVRAIHKNPMGSCVEISRMMYQSVGELRDALSGHNPAAAAPDTSTNSAKLLSFPRRA